MRAIKKKIDSNQPGIVQALRDIPGCSVDLDHDDIFVGFQGVNYWFEIKHPDAVSKRTGLVKEKRLEPSQIRLRDKWQGHYSIVWSIEQILKEILKMSIVNYKFSLDDRVVTVFGKNGIVVMLGFDDGGNKYYVQTADLSDWFKECDLKKGE